MQPSTHREEQIYSRKLLWYLCLYQSGVASYLHRPQHYGALYCSSIVTDGWFPLDSDIRGAFIDWCNWSFLSITHSMACYGFDGYWRSLSTTMCHNNNTHTWGVSFMVLLREIYLLQYKIRFPFKYLCATKDSNAPNHKIWCIRVSCDDLFFEKETDKQTDKQLEVQTSNTQTLRQAGQTDGINGRDQWSRGKEREEKKNPRERSQQFFRETEKQTGKQMGTYSAATQKQ